MADWLGELGWSGEPVQFVGGRPDQGSTAWFAAFARETGTWVYHTTGPVSSDGTRLILDSGEIVHWHAHRPTADSGDAPHATDQFGQLRPVGEPVSGSLPAGRYFSTNDADIELAMDLSEQSDREVVLLHVDPDGMVQVTRADGGHGRIGADELARYLVDQEQSRPIQLYLPGTATTEQTVRLADQLANRTGRDVYLPELGATANVWWGVLRVRPGQSWRHIPGSDVGPELVSDGLGRLLPPEQAPQVQRTAAGFGFFDDSTARRDFTFTPVSDGMLTMGFAVNAEGQPVMRNVAGDELPVDIDLVHSLMAERIVETERLQTLQLHMPGMTVYGEIFNRTVSALLKGPVTDIVVPVSDELRTGGGRRERFTVGARPVPIRPDDVNSAVLASLMDGAAVQIFERGNGSLLRLRSVLTATDGAVTWAKTGEEADLEQWDRAVVPASAMAVVTGLDSQIGTPTVSLADGTSVPVTAETMHTLWNAPVGATVILALPARKAEHETALQTWLSELADSSRHYLFTPGPGHQALVDADGRIRSVPTDKDVVPGPAWMRHLTTVPEGGAVFPPLDWDTDGVLREHRYAGVVQMPGAVFWPSPALAVEAAFRIYGPWTSARPAIRPDVFLIHLHERWDRVMEDPTETARWIRTVGWREGQPIQAAWPGLMSPVDSRQAAARSDFLDRLGHELGVPVYLSAEPTADVALADGNVRLLTEADVPPGDRRWSVVGPTEGRNLLATDHLGQLTTERIAASSAPNGLALYYQHPWQGVLDYSQTEFYDLALDLDPTGRPLAPVSEPTGQQGGSWTQLQPAEPGDLVNLLANAQAYGARRWNGEPLRLLVNTPANPNNTSPRNIIFARWVTELSEMLVPLRRERLAARAVPVHELVRDLPVEIYAPAPSTSWQHSEGLNDVTARWERIVAVDYLHPSGSAPPNTYTSVGDVLGYDSPALFPSASGLVSAGRVSRTQLYNESPSSTEFLFNNGPEGGRFSNPFTTQPHPGLFVLDIVVSIINGGLYVIDRSSRPRPVDVDQLETIIRTSWQPGTSIQIPTRFRLVNGGEITVNEGTVPIQTRQALREVARRLGTDAYVLAPGARPRYLYQTQSIVSVDILGQPMPWERLADDDGTGRFDTDPSGALVPLADVTPVGQEILGGLRDIHIPNGILLPPFNRSAPERVPDPAAAAAAERVAEARARLAAAAEARRRAKMARASAPETAETTDPGSTSETTGTADAANALAADQAIVATAADLPPVWVEAAGQQPEMPFLGARRDEFVIVADGARDRVYIPLSRPAPDQSAAADEPRRGWTDHAAELADLIRDGTDEQLRGAVATRLARLDDPPPPPLVVSETEQLRLISTGSTPETVDLRRRKWEEFNEHTVRRRGADMARYRTEIADLQEELARRVREGTGRPDRAPISPGQLAELMRRHGYDGRRPVRLIVNELEYNRNHPADRVPEFRSFAGRLADLIGQPVYAPTSVVDRRAANYPPSLYGADGEEPGTTEAEQNPGTWVRLTPGAHLSETAATWTDTDADTVVDLTDADPDDAGSDTEVEPTGSDTEPDPESSIEQILAPGSQAP
ncbi:hypothetical protein [Micromonospora echinofusca]|uniref:Uncharacterized protein n=1 Tax=Micromonospora echinofusca TaxID=47858 RepID=A0ABS3VX94_MICEH|nr:hypothetical protein [Micromonospora echinofusca]MBO4208983.1 hypothetical protein [Micromonospora echinofusca]